MEKKIKTVRYIPTIVVETASTGEFIATSSCLYEDLSLAKEVLESLKKNYGSNENWSIVRESVVRKVIEL